MTVSFRNLDFDPKTPVDEWPAEAILTVIERGALSDWRELARAIRANPWGPAARSAEAVVGWGEHYGADALIATVVRRAREELVMSGRGRYAAMIRAWRTERRMTLRDFAALAGTSATRLSDYEHAKVAPTTDVLSRLEHVYRISANRADRRARPPRGSGAARAPVRPAGRGSRH